MINHDLGRTKDVRFYVPQSFSEIIDLLASMIGHAPTFVRTEGYFQDRNIETEFGGLTKAFDLMRGKLGEERYAALNDLAARAKALFAADPDDTNGKTDEGIRLIWEMEAIINSVRTRRVKEKLPDEDGEVTGD